MSSTLEHQLPRNITRLSVKDAPHDGVMVALFIPYEVGSILYEQVAPYFTIVPLPSEEYHITLAYLGKASEIDAKRPQIEKALLEFVRTSPEFITGKVGGIGRFTSEAVTTGLTPIYASFDSPMLPAFRQSLVECLAKHGIAIDEQHGFTPHITLAYIPADDPMPDIPLAPIPMDFYELCLAWGEAQQAFFLGGATKRLKIVKSADGSHIVGGYVCVWGNPDEVDLAGDYFTPDSDLALDWYSEIPIFAEHTMIDDTGQDVDYENLDDEATQPRKVKIGKAISKTIDDIGLYVEALLEDSPLVQKLIPYIRAGKRFWSGGTVGHLARRDEDGFLRAWPLIEASIVRNPCQVRHTEVEFLKGFIEPPVYAQLQASLVRGARAESVNSDSPKTKIPQRTKIMELKFDDRLQYYRSAVDAHMPAIAEFVKSLKAKADGDEEDTEDETKEAVNLSEALLAEITPLAERLATVAGGDAGQAAALMTQYALDQLQAAAGGGEAEVMADVEDDEDEYMSAPKSEAAVVPAKRSPAAPSYAKGFGGFLVRSTKSQTRQPKESLTTFIRAVAAKNHGYLQPRAMRTRAHYKALGINPDTAGGYLAPPEEADEVIELLRSTSALNDYVKTLPMNRDVLNIPKQTSGATTYWAGENTQLTASEQSFGQVTLIARKMTCLVKLSNELLADSSPDIDAFVREDISSQMAVEYDRVILRGSGIANEPRGLLNIAGITQTSGANLAYSHLVGCQTRLEEANVIQDDSWGWIFTPTIKGIIQQMEDTEGQNMWLLSSGFHDAAAGRVPPELLGYKWAQTTQAGSGNLFLARWNDVIVGMRKTIEIRASDEAGQAFEYDQTWIRAILRMDVAVRHEESVEILTGCS